MSTVERPGTDYLPPGFTPEEWAEIVAQREARAARCLEGLDRTPRRRDVDENGRLLPISDEEWKARLDRFWAMVEEWKTWPDTDPPGAHDEAMRAIAEARHASETRPLVDEPFDL